MQKIRINDLARELEVKSKAILDVLPIVGVTEKKTHSSSIEVDEAEKVRAHFQKQAEAHGGAPSKSSRAPRPDDGIRTKIDLSHISKPGDVLKAITQQQTSPAAPPAPARQMPVAPPPAPLETNPAIPAVKPPVPPPSPVKPVAPAESAPITPSPAPPLVTPPTVS